MANDTHKACLLCNGTGEHRWPTGGEKQAGMEPCPRCAATGVEPGRGK